MTKNSTQEKDENDSVPPRFEIIRRLTTTKINRERDNRVQWTTTASMVLSFALLASVIINVYQSISIGGLVFYAQDIRTGELTSPNSVPLDKIAPGAKVGPAPMYTEAFLDRIDKQTVERRSWLNSLYKQEPLAQPAAVAASGSLPAVNQTK